MIPGPYSVCRISFPEGSDAAIYTTIRRGYDTTEDALADIPELAKEEDTPAEELVVIQFINQDDESSGFADQRQSEPKEK